MHRTFRAFPLPEDTTRADFTDPQSRLYGACPQRSREVAGYGFGEVGACVVEQTVSEGEGRIPEKNGAV